MTRPEPPLPASTPNTTGPEPPGTNPQATRQVGAGTLAFAGRVLVATVVVVAVVAVLTLLVYGADLLLLLFAGALVSIPLRRFGALVERWTGLGCGASLALATVVLAVLALSIAGVAAGRVAVQASELTEQLQVAVKDLQGRLEGNRWAAETIDRLPSIRDFLFGSGAVSRISGLASTTFGSLINALVVIVVAIYLASQPRVYSGGIKHLLPMAYRARADEVLAVLDEALGRWLFGRLALMVVNGALTTLALWLLGVPLALTLGVIAGLLNFVPNFGPLIAAVPAILIAWTVSLPLALYTALVYVGVQAVDGYVLTPLVDRKSVELPPVVTIAAQLLLAVLFGFVGLLVASPLTATLLILVKMLYVEDVLGDPIMRKSALADPE